MSTLFSPQSWGPPPTRRSWFGRHKILTAVLGLIAIFIALGIIGEIIGPQPKKTATPVTTKSSRLAKATATHEKPSSTSTPDAPTLTTEIPAPPIKTAHYHGSGDSIVRIKKPTAGPVILSATYHGGANFIITTPDDAQLLVNHIGDYKGAVLLDPDANDDTTRLKVQASGPWTITLAETAAAKTWSGHISGQGDAVLMYTGKSGVVTLTHRGTGNFIVKTFGGSFDDLMVNKIGNYKGQDTINDGPVLLQLTASGRWTMKVEED